MARGVQVQVRTYRGFRFDLGEDAGGGWHIVIHPAVGLPGRIETLRESARDGLPRLLDAARAHVDAVLDQAGAAGPAPGAPDAGRRPGDPA